MALADWLGELLRLNTKALEGKLEQDERVRYERCRDELADAIVSSQRIVLRPGEAARHAMPVAQMVPVEIDMPSGPLRTTTVEVSARGFAALLGGPPDVGQRLQVLLKIGRRESVGGETVVSDVKMQPFNYRVQFNFLNLSPPEREKLEEAVFQMLLSQMASRQQ